MKITDKDDLKNLDDVLLRNGESVAGGKVYEITFYAERHPSAGQVKSVRITGHEQDFLLGAEATTVGDWGRRVWTVEQAERSDILGVVDTILQDVLNVRTMGTLLEAGGQNAAATRNAAKWRFLQGALERLAEAGLLVTPGATSVIVNLDTLDAEAVTKAFGHPVTASGVREIIATAALPQYHKK